MYRLLIAVRRLLRQHRHITHINPCINPTKKNAHSTLDPPEPRKPRNWNAVTPHVPRALATGAPASAARRAAFPGRGTAAAPGRSSQLLAVAESPAPSPS